MSITQSRTKSFKIESHNDVEILTTRLPQQNERNIRLFYQDIIENERILMAKKIQNLRLEFQKFSSLKSDECELRLKNGTDNSQNLLSPSPKRLHLSMVEVFNFDYFPSIAVLENSKLQCDHYLPPDEYETSVGSESLMDKKSVQNDLPECQEFLDLTASKLVIEDDLSNISEPFDDGIVEYSLEIVSSKRNNVKINKQVNESFDDLFSIPDEAILDMIDSDSLEVLDYRDSDDSVEIITNQSKKSLFCTNPELIRPDSIELPVTTPQYLSGSSQMKKPGLDLN